MKICVSEKEARSKTCPLSMSAPRGELCIGSECMAWRWVRTHINDAPGEPMYESDNTHGYCGLAGLPWSGA